MRRLTIPLVLLLLFLGISPTAFGQIDTDEISKEVQESDRQLLQKVGVKTDATSLLKYFQERTYPEVDPKIMQQLIDQLDDFRFEVREKAFKKILGYGTGAMVSLRAASKQRDPEAAVRVNELLNILKEKANPEVQAAVARLLAVQNVKQATGVILNYLPFAADDMVKDELKLALVLLTKQSKKADPALIESLSDKVSTIRRQFAAETILLASAKEQLPKAIELLQDPKVQVRMRVALAMLEQKENATRKKAIDALVKDLGKIPVDQIWEVENILLQLASEDAPQISIATTKEDIQKFQLAWASWWAKNKTNLDLAKLDEPKKIEGKITVVYQKVSRVVNGRLERAHEVMELDKNKKEIWKFDVENTFPVDAQVIGKDRVIVAEYNGRAITERDFEGKVRWRYSVPNNPTSIQVLANGNYFITCRNLLLELNRNRKEVFRYSTNNLIYRACKMKNGLVVTVNNRGQLEILNPRSKKVLKTFNIGTVGTYYGNIQPLDNGNILIPFYTSNRVAEYTPNGKQVWQVTTSRPNSAIRLPNGNTIVGSLSTRTVEEFNRKGDRVWNRRWNGQLYQVSVR